MFCFFCIRNLAIGSVKQVQELVSIVAQSMDMLIVVGEGDNDCDVGQEGKKEKEMKIERGTTNQSLEISGIADELGVEDIEKETSSLVIPVQSHKHEEIVSRDDDKSRVTAKHSLVSKEDKIHQSIVAYRDCLAGTSETLKALRQYISKTRGLFALASNEPQLWYR